jgi:predicted SAM-dependent methyltransferase
VWQREARVSASLLPLLAQDRVRHQGAPDGIAGHYILRMPSISRLRRAIQGSFGDVPGAFRTRSYAVALQARSIYRKAVEPSRIKAYLRTHHVRKLQIGTGSNPIAGWLNTDLLPDSYPEHRKEIVFLDASKPFPFNDATFDYVFSEHQIEHIPEPAARTMVRECFRVLCPGGRIRVATPDLAAMIALYEGPTSDSERHYIDWVMERFRPDVRSGNRTCHVINHMFKDHHHQFIYDYETLASTLADAGFVGIERRQPGDSDDPALRGIEAHGRAIGDESVNRFETMVIEAVRPKPGS